MVQSKYSTVLQLIGNEWITTPLLMKFLENLCKSYVNNLAIFGVNARELFSNVSLYIMPMVNPDGVDLVTDFITENSWAYANAKRIARYSISKWLESKYRRGGLSKLPPLDY